MQETLTIEQIDKIGNTVIYLSSRVGELAKTKLLKLLFLIEEKSITEYGTPFFYLDFKVWQFGPVVEVVYNEISNEKTEIFKDYFKKNIFDEFEQVTGFNDDEFSNNEVALLDDMVGFSRNKTAKDFVKITHSPKSLWTRTAKKHGVFNELEYGELTKTDLSIEFEMIFENNTNSYIFERYINSIENNIFSKNFKYIKGV